MIFKKVKSRSTKLWCFDIRFYVIVFLKPFIVVLKVGTVHREDHHLQNTEVPSSVFHFLVQDPYA